MVIDKLFLDGSIKAFTVGIHFGGFGVGMPMWYRKFFEESVEALLEFTAIVGQHFLEGIGVGALRPFKNPFCPHAGMARYSRGKRIPTEGVGMRNQVSFLLSQAPLYGIQTDALSR